MKKLLSLFLPFLIIACLSGRQGFWNLEFARGATFPDVKSPVLLEAVQYLNGKGIIKGYSDGTFKPEQVINRAEALKIIFETVGITANSQLPTANLFPDVPKNEWFAPYVSEAKTRSLISGYADGTYKPNQPVNKVEFLKIAMLAQAYYENPVEVQSVVQQFKDVDSKQWYIPYLGFALQKGFLDKVEKFNPDKGLTRAEAALIIYRVAKFNEDPANLVKKPGAEDAVLSCETCVKGVDLIKEYPFLKDHELVEIKGGKILIYGEDVTSVAHDKRSIVITLEGAENSYIRDTTPYEEKVNFEKKYPEYYERVLGINGGIQSGDAYMEGGGGIWRNKGGKSIGNCECAFELGVINLYNHKGYTETFDEWRRSDAGKEKIFFYVIADINNDKYLDE